MQRRVVITGMGAVSPNGVGNAAFADGILAGRSGVRRISHFDPGEIPVQIAGEVPDFDELAWVEKRERKHVSRVLPLALAAATEALHTAGLDPASLPLEHKRRFGVILGSGGGSQEFTEEQYRLFFHQQYKQMSLFCVPTGVMDPDRCQRRRRQILRARARRVPDLSGHGGRSDVAARRPVREAVRCFPYSKPRKTPLVPAKAGTQGAK